MSRRVFIKKTALVAAGTAITAPVSVMLTRARRDGNTFCCINFIR